ncbi:uncharacterized protein [Haliotis asinina]|uniref:uncharacterized protein n=1 Tax=Haliotis asinina TaxID=109174 RepID=UPI00353207B5
MSYFHKFVIMMFVMEFRYCHKCDSQKLRPLTAFDNVQVREYVLWEVYLDKLDCLGKCFHDVRCHSFQTLGSSGRCTGHATAFASPDKIYSPTVGSPGARMYLLHLASSFVGSGCTSDGDCRLEHTYCNDGICNCQPGIVFSVGRSACVTECTEWGNDIVRYLHRSIDGYNNQRISGVTEAACRQLCLAANSSTFTCTSVDYYNDKCWLSNKTFLSVPESDRGVGTSYVYYERTCL